MPRATARRTLALGAASLLGIAGMAPTTGSAEAAQAATCGGLRATIIVTQGDDNLRGTSGRDVIAGLGGEDDIVGLGGNDVICGGAGEDDIEGGAGNDRIRGGSAGDDIEGNAGNDHIWGGSGNDDLEGTAVATTCGAARATTRSSADPAGTSCAVARDAIACSRVRSPTTTEPSADVRREAVHLKLLPNPRHELG
ncbi:calcium-binding protein [Mumia sp. ZJ1417]|uniref:calcium-binding protein n=1 Tax=Mumia sp. ZJ1417 TaxID=2708082 RepID=UPI001AB034B7|nr:calcium-binding protein [Mumia sp. ZJ1417]